MVNLTPQKPNPAVQKPELESLEARQVRCTVLPAEAILDKTSWMDKPRAVGRRRNFQRVSQTADEGKSPKPAGPKAPTATCLQASLPDDVMAARLRLIARSERSVFEKRVWTALCHIPRGCVTTYGMLSTHLGSSPRAVGNALRRNPFASDVPCHRVVATGMTLGGFKGKWPRNGEGITLDEKRRLLKSEGVRFDDQGKVLGTPWTGWEPKLQKRQ